MTSGLRVGGPSSVQKVLVLDPSNEEVIRVDTSDSPANVWVTGHARLDHRMTIDAGDEGFIELNAASGQGLSVSGLDVRVYGANSTTKFDVQSEDQFAGLSADTVNKRVIVRGDIYVQSGDAGSTASQLHVRTASGSGDFALLDAEEGEVTFDGDVTATGNLEIGGSFTVAGAIEAASLTAHSLAITSPTGATVFGVDATTDPVTITQPVGHCMYVKWFDVPAGQSVTVVTGATGAGSERGTHPYGYGYDEFAITGSITGVVPNDCWYPLNAAVLWDTPVSLADQDRIVTAGQDIGFRNTPVNEGVGSLLFYYTINSQVYNPDNRLINLFFPLTAKDSTPYPNVCLNDTNTATALAFRVFYLAKPPDPP